LFPVALWLAVVLLSLAVMNWLFPRPRRGLGDAPNLDLPPWYPPPLREPVVASQPASIPNANPRADPGFWRANVRTIGALLLLWIAAAFGPVALAPWLNTIQILTGFPLGYYMSGQGSLLIFLGIITAYVVRVGALDRRFGAAPAADADRPRLHPRLAFAYLLFALGFALLVRLLSSFEASIDTRSTSVGWVLLSLTIGLYGVIGYLSRTRNLDDYLVAGRRVPAFFNGMAIAGDWMSAATFISLAGTLWLLGHEGLAYILGWTGGYVILAMLLAPYLRKFGQFTVPDFIAARYGGVSARVVSAVIAIVISFTYMTAQVTGIGLIMSRFLGVNFVLGVIVGLGSVLFCSVLGGMRAITWTQVAQCIVMLIAYITPVSILSSRLTGVPIPQLMYGEALRQIQALESAQGIATAYAAPFNDWTPWNFMAIMLCLMLGTAGLPHILIRFLTTPSAADARKSAGWGLFFICVMYLTIPAYAAFSRWEVLANVVGQSSKTVPRWVENWSQTGLLTLVDRNADGIFQLAELSIDRDLVVLATPEIAGLPSAISALVAVGGMAAALSTADGLLLVIGSALSHDIYARAINPSATLPNRLLLGRVAIFVAATLAAITAIRRLGIIVQLVAWAFSFAAATFFPALVFGIFWKRANAAGAISGMIAGLFVTLAYMVAVSASPQLAILGIASEAAGAFGLLANILVTTLVSLRTSPPDPAALALVDDLRRP
jgi:cation/acetate symporter